MIPKSLLKPLLALGLANSALAIKSQAEANARCNKYQPGTMAVLKPDGSDWGSCITPPPPSLNVCFDEEYTDPKTGLAGCCPEGLPFSYDSVSLEGKCCPASSPFSYDPKYKTGDCCGAGIAFKCSCGGGQTAPPPPLCPASNNDIYTSGSRSFKVLCGVDTFGDSIPSTTGTDLRDCTDKCAATIGCVSTSFYLGTCYPKSRVVSTAANPNVQSVIQITQISPSDNCPGLSTDGSQKRYVGSIEYKFYCGKYVVTSVGLVKPSYKVASLQQCLEDCNANLQCMSVYYGFGNVLGANRVTECNLVGATESTPSGVNIDFVAAIPDPPRAAALIPLSASDTCPGLSTDGSQRRIEGSNAWKFFCGKYVIAGPLLRASYKVSSLKQCVQDCVAEPACMSIYYGFGNTLGANRVGECNLVSGTQVTPTGVNADFVAGIPDPQRVPGPSKAMSATDTCPALGLDQQIKRTEGGVTFGFSCGKFIAGGGATGQVKPPHIVANLQACCQECAAAPGCRGLHFGLAGAQPPSRVNECVLLSGVGASSTGGTDANWVAGVAIGR